MAVEDAMEKSNLADGALGPRQLEKYARDFSGIYRFEKRQGVELEAANAQLTRYVQAVYPAGRRRGKGKGRRSSHRSHPASGLKTGRPACCGTGPRSDTAIMTG
jgi:hypothetical protein